MFDDKEIAKIVIGNTFDILKGIKLDTISQQKVEDYFSAKKIKVLNALLFISDTNTPFAKVKNINVWKITAFEIAEVIYSKKVTINQLLNTSNILANLAEVNLPLEFKKTKNTTVRTWLPIVNMAVYNGCVYMAFSPVFLNEKRPTLAPPEIDF